MIDVGSKATTDRKAVAQAFVNMQEETLQAILADEIEKGPVFIVSKLAGINGAKQCATLLPLCHPLPIDKVVVDIAVHSPTQVQVTAQVRTHAKTGVEMEALAAVQACCLCIYDMCKSRDRGMVVTDVQLLEKSGGKSGDWSSADQ